MKKAALLMSHSWIFILGVIVVLFIAITCGLHYFGKL